MTAEGERAASGRTKRGWSWLRREPMLYLVTAILAYLPVTWMMQLWRADWTAPFYYQVDAVGSMAHFKTTIETGWYESAPRLGVPYGQHYHDYPFSDDLHPLMAKVFGWLTGGNWIAAFNGYYLATFGLCAVAAVWFFRQVGLSGPLSVALSVLFAVTPYHFYRNETHLFLSGYYIIPLSMVIVLRLARGERIWDIRTGVPRFWGVLTGRGAATVVIIGLQVYDGIYYTLFVGLLAAAAALLAWARDHNHRRMFGAVILGGVLLAWCYLAMLPDNLYAQEHGEDTGSVVRQVADVEWYGLKFMQLILPANQHPLPIFAELRNWYNSNFPVPNEYPALGLIAALGFLGLLGYGLRSMVGRRRNATDADHRNAAGADLDSVGEADRDGAGSVDREETDPRGGGVGRRGADGVRGAEGIEQSNAGALSMLVWVAFLLSTVGGAGVALSMKLQEIRGWNRMSIVIALISLAGFGLGIQALVRWVLRKTTARLPERRRAARAALVRRWVPGTLLTLLLVIGLADQSIGLATPAYAQTSASFHSDQRFFGALQAKLPAGAMVFQLPYMAYPESLPKAGASESDQLKPYLQTTTLRWSGGGIKGRPQTDWPAEMERRLPEDMTKDLAIIGFSGILIDRVATDDHGYSLEQGLEPYTGEPEMVSDDGRWAYLSLATQLVQVGATMSPAERASEVAALVHADG